MTYPSDLRDNEWALVKGYFEQGRAFGRPLERDRREIVNAIFYVTKSGCQWRMLPSDFPPWQTVYYYFHRWCTEGIWEKVLDVLNKKDRVRQGRAPDPTYGIVDSQSTKTQYNSDERGIDGGKKVKGRKRHIVTDSEGHLLQICVHAANCHDTKAAPTLLD
jgi:putative transposase